MHSDRKIHCVYIITNGSKVLYIGVTNNLERTVWELKHHNGSEFTRRYHLDRLVYWDSFDDACQAIDREKHIKGRLRIKKIALIAQETRPRA